MDWIGGEGHALFVLLVVFLATLIRSTFGFGDGLVAVPLLTLTMGVRTATPLIAMISTAIAAIVTFSDWRHVQLKSVCWLVGFSLAGIPFGLLLLKWGPEDVVKAILGTVVLGFSLYALRTSGDPDGIRRTSPRFLQLYSDRSAWAFGVAAGVLGGAYCIPGPPLVVFGTMRRWSAERFRATLQGYFLPTSLLIVAGHGAAGLWRPVVFAYFAGSLPLVIVAVWLGRRLNRRFDSVVFVRYVYGLLAILGAALLLSALVT